MNIARPYSIRLKLMHRYQVDESFEFPSAFDILLLEMYLEVFVVLMSYFCQWHQLYCILHTGFVTQS
jgi:hypothetical protein